MCGYGNSTSRDQSDAELETNNRGSAEVISRCDDQSPVGESEDLHRVLVVARLELTCCPVDTSVRGHEQLLLRTTKTTPPLGHRDPLACCGNREQRLELEVARQLGTGWPQRPREFEPLLSVAAAGERVAVTRAVGWFWSSERGELLVETNEEAITILVEAITKAGFVPGEQIAIALDPAMSKLYRDGAYHLEGEGKVLSADAPVGYWRHLVESYPIVSIEDGMAEDDWDGWAHLTGTIGHRVQLVGDDLFVTNVRRLRQGIDAAWPTPCSSRSTRSAR